MGNQPFLPKKSGTLAIWNAFKGTIYQVFVLFVFTCVFINTSSRLSSATSQVMEGGHITQSGSYVELLKAGTAFEQLMNAHHDAMAVFESVNMEQMDEARKTGVNQMGSTGLQLSRETSEGEISVKGVSKIQLTQDEEKEIGNVGWKPYNDYIYVSKGTILFASLVLLHTLFVILQSASTYWLAIAIQIPHIGNAVLLGVYAGISTFNCISVYLRTLAATHLGLKASKEFFTGLMNSLFKAPILFFDSTPVGRILTRVRILTVLFMKKKKAEFGYTQNFYLFENFCRTDGLSIPPYIKIKDDSGIILPTFTCQINISHWYEKSFGGVKGL